MTFRPTAIRRISELSLGVTGERQASESAAMSVEALYLEHYASIYRYLVVTGSSPADADEFVQDAFLRLHTALRRGQRVEKPRQWLVSVAHNLRIENAQRASRTAEPAGSDSADPAPTQEQILLDNERMQRLQEAMDHLTSRQREYLHLRAEGLRLREIADIYGVTLQSVAEACSRAIQVLGRLTQ